MRLVKLVLDLAALKLRSITSSRLLSILSCSISLLSQPKRRSSSGSRRQFSIDNHIRHRGSDEPDPPLLIEADADREETGVVIGAEQGNEADQHTANGLNPTLAIKTQQRLTCFHRVWRSWRTEGNAEIRVAEAQGAAGGQCPIQNGAHAP